MNLFDLYCKISIDDSDVETGIDKTKKSMASASTLISAKAVAIGNAMYDMGKKAANNLMQMGKYALDVGTTFDSSMANVSAISGATGEELDALREKAKEMGAQTKFSASESADAFSYMAMAGWKTGDMLSGIEGIMNLAAASGENLATVSDIVTDALTAFGLAAEDSGHFADVLAAASNSANTNVSMLGESFKYVAPVAGALGYSVEDVSVALGLMANSGIKASQAGTSLRSALSRMVDPTEDMWNAIKNLGLAASDAGDDFSGVLNNFGEYNAIMYNSDGSTKSFADTMKTLRDAFSKLTESEKTYYATNLFGQEAMSGMLAIINSSDTDFEKLTNAINSADGTAQSMADTMNNNLPGAITIMKSALEGLGVAIYENGSGKLQEFVGKITQVISKATEFVGSGGLEGMIDGFTKLIPVITGTVAAIGAYRASMAISKLIDTVKNATESMTIAQAALNAIMNANPFVLVATMIAAVGTALVTLYMTNEDFRNKVNAAWSTVKDTISNVVSALKTFFTTTLPGAIDTAVDWLENLPDKFREVGANLLTGLWDGISDKIAWLKDKVTGVVDTIKGWFTGKDGFDEHSPSKWSKQVFRYVMEGGGEGLDAGLPGLMQSVGSVTDRVKYGLDFGTASVDFASSGLGSIGKTIISGATNNAMNDRPIYTNVTIELDGSVVARKLFGPLRDEERRRGTSFVY